MVFHYQYNSETLAATVVGMVVSIVFLLTPWVRFIKLRTILKSSHLIQAGEEGKVTKENMLEDGPGKSYEDYRHFFIIDYDRANPISAKKANKEWVR